MKFLNIAKYLPFIIGGLLLAFVSFAENQQKLEQETISSSQESSRLWNLQDEDILSVINEVSQETGRNFVVDPRVNGKITLISSKPLRKNEVYQVFLSVLGLLR